MLMYTIQCNNYGATGTGIQKIEAECCNTASESGGDLRGQQFAKTSPTDYLSKGPATTPPNPGKMTVSQTVLAGRCR